MELALKAMLEILLSAETMGKTYSRYRSFNDAVSLTIFIAIDNAQFVKFITEVQDKTAKLCHWQR